MNSNDLPKVLTAARYKILVSVRPLASAKIAYDMVVSELIGKLRQDNCDGEVVAKIEALKFND